MYGRIKVMKILKEYPPNYSEIKQYLKTSENAVFTYGDDIYCPSGAEIPEDILFHERVHTTQQAGDPYKWWTRYMHDEDFRFSQEIQAYAEQYDFVKKHFPTRAHKECLHELALNLSSLYNVGKDYHQCYTAIRKWK